MKRLAFVTVLVVSAACTPKIEKNTTPPAQIQARFDPAATPPVVPAPNDLAIDPVTGKVVLPLPAGASGADQELVEHFSHLDGFPADSSASATFTGEVDPATAPASNPRSASSLRSATISSSISTGVRCGIRLRRPRPRLDRRVAARAEPADDLADPALGDPVAPATSR